MPDNSKTIVVSPDGSGDFRAIQEAVDEAQPGDMVLVKPGTYTEDVYLKQGITLRGEDPESCTIKAAEAYAAVARNISAATIIGLTLDGNHKEQNPAVWIVASKVTIEGCVITGAELSGIQAGEKSRITLRKNRIHNNKAAGVFILKESEGTVEENTLFENGLHGIEVKNKGKLTARLNNIHHNKQSGVLIQKEGEGTLEENTLFENGYHGIEVREKGRLTARGNTIAHNSYFGVWIYEEGVGHLQDNIIAYNKRWGLSSLGNTGDKPAAEVKSSHNCLWQNSTDYEGEMEVTRDFKRDPLFVDAEHHDYRLRPDSPCIGAGVSGNNVGALPVIPVEKPVPDTSTTDEYYMSLLAPHLLSLALSHTTPPAPLRPATWFAGAASLGIFPPLLLTRDLGFLLSQPLPHDPVSRPPYLPEDMDTASYLTFLNTLRQYPLIKTISAWNLSDPVIGVILAKIFQGLSFPSQYQLPSGLSPATYKQYLEKGLEKIDLPRLWQDTSPSRRPTLDILLPSQVMTQIETNVRRLDRGELQFLHLYGPRNSHAPDPRDLLDLFQLIDLPHLQKLAVNQVMRFIPMISRVKNPGSTQLYPMGGYEGLTRKGHLDSLVLSELAYPDDIFLHRLLNHEALYYGRESEQSPHRALVYIITQTGLEIKGDGDLLARSLTLALARTMQRRGYDVYQGFSGTQSPKPGTMNQPSDLHRILYYKDENSLLPTKTLTSVINQLKTWKDQYRDIQVFWVLEEHWDMDDCEDHEDLYQQLKSLAGHYAWFIRVGANNPKQKNPIPEITRYFHRYKVMNTEILWNNK